VDADIVAGRVSRLSLRSLRGNPCRLADPWPGEALEVRSDGRCVDFELRGGIVEFGTRPNRVYQVRRRVSAPEPPAEAASEQASVPLGTPIASEGECGPVRYTGPAFVGHVPQGKRVDVWMGMPSQEPPRGPR